MSEQQQQQASFTQHLVNNNNVLNKKVDKLAEALEALTIGDDIKEYIGAQLAGIRQEGSRQDYKVKDLVTYDGKTQKLRSWLTAANLQLVNKNVEGEERKVRFVSGYFRGRAWDWFEPILRESDERPRTEWSSRTTRIMGSYKELKRAMGQVFGAIDERKDAAEKLQRLRQTRSVTDYITDFQVITSSLDWDEEALEDKFLEGLKQEIRKALVYYPTEPQNLEELFERAQRIDRELWGQQRNSGKRENYGNPKTRFFKQQTYRTDRDGDITMKGAKVNVEKARKEGLCYNCGLAGHQARNCRKPKQERKKDSRPNAKIRMLRSGRIEDHERATPGNPRTTNPASTAETQMFEGLTLEDLTTEPSIGDSDEQTLDFEEDTGEKGILKWRQEILESERMNRSYPRARGYRGRYRPFGAQNSKNKTSRMPGRQPEGGDNHRGIQVMTQVSGGKEPRSSQDLKTVEKPTEECQPRTVEGSRKIEERLASVDFSKLTKTNRPGWREFCREYNPEITVTEIDTPVTDSTKDVGQNRKKGGYPIYDIARNVNAGRTRRARLKDIRQKANA